MGAIVIATTVGTEEQANLLANELVARRLAACVNIIKVHRSVYRWQGKICDDCEYLLFVKSMESEYELIEAMIKELHSYEQPEILSFKVTQGEPGFLAWIAASLDKNAAFEDEIQQHGES